MFCKNRKEIFYVALRGKRISGIYAGSITITCDLASSYDVNATTLTHVWIFYAADHSLWPIKNKKGCQISSVAGDNDHCKACPYHAQHPSTETTWST